MSVAQFLLFVLAVCECYLCHPNLRMDRRDSSFGKTTHGQVSVVVSTDAQKRSLGVARAATATPNNLSLLGNTYSGCYAEANPLYLGPSPQYLLTGQSYTSLTGMTWAACTTYCANFQYAGISGGSICRCGNSFSYSPILGLDLLCSTPCSGNYAQSCGGAGQLSIFRNSNFGLSSLQFSLAPGLTSPTNPSSQSSAISRPISSTQLSISSLLTVVSSSAVISTSIPPVLPTSTGTVQSASTSIVRPISSASSLIVQPISPPNPLAPILSVLAPVIQVVSSLLAPPSTTPVSSSTSPLGTPMGLLTIIQPSLPLLVTTLGSPALLPLSSPTNPPILPIIPLSSSPSVQAPVQLTLPTVASGPVPMLSSITMLSIIPTNIGSPSSGSILATPSTNNNQAGVSQPSASALDDGTNITLDVVVGNGTIVDQVHSWSFFSSGVVQVDNLFLSPVTGPLSGFLLDGTFVTMYYDGLHIGYHLVPYPDAYQTLISQWHVLLAS